MSTAARKKPATYEDLLAVPDHLVAEILDGELITSPRPALRHAHASSTLGRDIGSFHGPPGEGGNPGGWWILDEPELHLNEDVVVPDIGGWRRERVPWLPDAAWLEIAPDWACEVISASTETIDRGRKLRMYARESVGWLWLVNPISKTLEVYRLSEPNWIVVNTFAGDEVVRAEPFETASLEMSRWWRPEPPSP